VTPWWLGALGILIVIVGGVLLKLAVAWCYSFTFFVAKQPTGLTLILFVWGCVIVGLARIIGLSSAMPQGWILVAVLTSLRIPAGREAAEGLHAAIGIKHGTLKYRLALVSLWLGGYVGSLTLYPWQTWPAR
jgi:hypothetical protein